MDYSRYYSFNEYESRPILDEKVHLLRRLTALFLCAVFIFPYIYYNLPYINTLPSENTYFSVSKDSDFKYVAGGKRNNITLRGSLNTGELQLSPQLSLGKTYRFLITTKNAVISAKDAILSVLSYVGNDGIYYTHIVCEKGNAHIGLYNDTESKVSLENKYLRTGYEALIYSDKNQIGFVRFEADGTTPRPGHGVYTREIKQESDLYEYLEIDPLYYSSFLNSTKYTPPHWGYDFNSYKDSFPIEESKGSDTSEDPMDFTICYSIMYFNRYIPWGEEDTLLDEEKESESVFDNYSNPTFIGAQKDIVINDNMKTLGGDVPLVLNSLTIHENYPGNALQIIGEVRVNSLILIAATGKDESHLIETDKENRVKPLINYFKLNESGSLTI